MLIVVFFYSFTSPQEMVGVSKRLYQGGINFFFSSKRRRLCRDRVLLTNKLISLRHCLVNGDNSVLDSIQDIECRLKATYTKEIEGILIRSPAEWLEEGERPSHYFF